jgi:hypothetical protein
VEAVAIAPPSVSAAVEERAPRMLDTYALLYAFTALWTVPALLLLAGERMYSYTPLYTLLVALPPGLGMLTLLISERAKTGWRSLLTRAVVLTVLTTAGSVLFIFGGMVAILPFALAWIVPHLMDSGPIPVVALIAVSSPLAIVLVREVRARRWVRALAIAAVVGIVVFDIVTGATPGALVVSVLRKDQISFFQGAMAWYLPSYGLAGAICRRVGLG